MSPADRRIAAVTGVCAVFCLLFPFVVTPQFNRLFGEYHGLPAMTELALRTWFPMVLGLVPTLVGGVALVTGSPRVLRLACALGVAACLVCIGSMVLPSLQPDVDLSAYTTHGP